MPILHFKILGLFFSIFSSSESFYLKLPPHLSCMKIKRKFVKILIFLQCNGMLVMFKSENIAVMNRTIHCTLRQDSKLTFLIQML